MCIAPCRQQYAQAIAGFRLCGSATAPDGITLTEQGRLAALQLIRRHRILEVFLVEVMGFTWDQIDVEAHRLEHSVSAAFEERMDRLANYPTRCPHGNLIPLKDGTFPEENLQPITTLEPGQRAFSDTFRF